MRAYQRITHDVIFWVRCGARLYRFLIFFLFLTFTIIIICLSYTFFQTLFRFYKIVLAIKSEKLRELLPFYITFLDITSSCFLYRVPCLNITLCNVGAKTGNQRYPRFNTLLPRATFVEFTICCHRRLMTKNGTHHIRNTAVTVYGNKLLQT